ncbi:hypothetical protein [Nocardioides sp. MH1]|uniref:hypothetical protein n=1 Tax=Nocardioides sp. MH1 TaxID=3242490 RepID=UPI003520D11C
MGYSVRLIKGEVIIPASKAEAALAAVHELDRRDDLKSGWTRDDDGVERRYWAFASLADVRAARTLSDVLKAFRFEPMLEPDGELYGVEFGGQNRGDEVHLWTALAPFVEPGGEMVWLSEDEDDALTRWTFDGSSLAVSAGRMVFD